MVLAKKGEMLIDRAFGFSNIHQKIEASNDRLHRIASISKVVTRLAIEKLCQKKKKLRSSFVFPDIFGKDYSTKLNTKADLITV